MGRKLFGRAKIKVNGQDIEINTGATLDVGGTARETQALANSVGYTEKIVPSKLEFEQAFGVGDTVTSFDSASSYQFQADTGQTFVCKACWRTDTPQLSEGGKLKIVLEGDPCAEIS